MQLQEKYQVNYNEFAHDYQLVLPLDLGIVIPADEPVRLLSQKMEELDYSRLMQAYSHLGRKPKVSPRTMFKIIVYANMNGIYSTREIEKACKNNINFMWLLQGQPVPDHNSINRFKKDKLVNVIEDLYYQFVMKLYEIGEIAFDHIFIDGTKIEANANKYTFVWRRATEKYEAKLHLKVHALVKQINEKFNRVFEVSEKVKIEQLEYILSVFNKYKEDHDITFVYGKGKNKTEIQRIIEELNEYIEKQCKYNNYYELFDGRNNFSKTDTDATFMHMKEDHMRNSQLKPGYNVQIGVEGEYIVGVDIFSNRADQPTLIPFLEMLKDNLPHTYTKIVADAGYASEENFVYLDLSEQENYIKPHTYEFEKTAKFKKQIGRKENMTYDKENDYFICQNNRHLKFSKETTKVTTSGYKSTIRNYECETCDDCPIRNNCYRGKTNKVVSFSPLNEEFKQIATNNITSEEGNILRVNRSIQVEGAFGVIKQDYAFRRFLSRGKENVKMDILLVCFGYNVNKLHKNMQKGNLGLTLFKDTCEVV